MQGDRERSEITAHGVKSTKSQSKTKDQKVFENCSTLLTITKMQIIPIKTYNLTPLQQLLTKRKLTSVGKNEKREDLKLV